MRGLIEPLHLGRHVRIEAQAVFGVIALQDPHRFVGRRGLNVAFRALRLYLRTPLPRA